MIPGHGVNAPRGQDAAAASRGGRFGRMFSLAAAELGDEALAALADLIAGADERGDENLEIPAAYTYLGQFIDHDITFDPTSALQRENDPDALVNFRTPRFDLDSLYGSGPADQPYLYDWGPAPHPGVKLLVGGGSGDPELAAVDLPRNQAGRALIGDARNDEHLIIAQLHLLLIRFHNRVIDMLHAREAWADPWAMFEEAQRIVRWHYQWIVMHDFLEKVVGADMARSVLVPGAPGEPPEVRRRYYVLEAEPVIPVEFSGAAYRFGHSMVRDDYPIGPGPNVPIFTHTDSPRHLGGFRPLPASLVVDWSRFLSGEIKSMRIDRRLAKPLLDLPPDHAQLPRLNLERGRALGLPSGQDVAEAMNAKRLARKDLLLDDQRGQAVPDAIRDALWHATPLWYYVVMEARTARYGRGGQQLGPVGGRIVAEVLAGLLEGDPHSYLRQRPGWTPAEEALGGAAGDFTLDDLRRFTLD